MDEYKLSDFHIYQIKPHFLSQVTVIDNPDITLFLLNDLGRYCYTHMVVSLHAYCRSEMIKEMIAVAYSNKRGPASNNPDEKRFKKAPTWSCHAIRNHLP